MAEATKIESIVSLPVVNPETQGRSRSFVFMGKADKVDDGKLIDWKSSSHPARFIKKRKIGFQPELYALALETRGIKIAEIEFRLVHTPGIGLTVNKPDNGDPKAYEDRCIEWIFRRGKYEFNRKGQPNALRLVEHTHQVTEARLLQARLYLWDCSQRILECRRADRWLPSPESCYLWKRECVYMPICEAIMDGADVEGVKRDWFRHIADTHAELGGAALTVEPTREVLTFSSLSTFRSCDMKYLFEHEERLVRADHDDDADARWLGSAMHEGLKAYGETRSLDRAKATIDTWADDNWVLGEKTVKFDQQCAKARAMVRAAAIRWPVD